MTDTVDVVSLLADPVRRRLYEYIATQAGPVTRDEAASATGLSRNLAAYHLDRLARANLLEVAFERVNGRSGPGAGRPAKRYTRTNRDVEVSLPPRRYGQFARIVAVAAESAKDPGFLTALTTAARKEGELLSADSEDLHSALIDAGYEPIPVAGGDTVLRNCPFHAVVEANTELACGLNHALIEGALCGAGCDPARAELSPEPGRCCVVIHPVPDNDDSPVAHMKGEE